jgi:hypothetical protein
VKLDGDGRAWDAPWITEVRKHQPTVIHDGVDPLGDDRFEGWEARPSAAATLMCVGVAILAGVFLVGRAARLLAGWLT